ncbi:hypothetical protein EUTSA_v10019551mg [Eutrema salsugineum]|uniref:Gnk2-homologous domain-containing protein n=1 Tax=Eutrema salsugineum TaxID=72664 RepID=V4KMW0_EUTSA|nr:cysteine-rich repeat secretory protein 34 [Eutrema salsugineum]ESQ28638.1 hypothetical protein EUTSA_v10019551mg [Eutrema salsugineum]
MYSSFSLPNRYVSIPILAINLFLIHIVSSLNLTNEYLNHKCLVSQGKYKPGSKYEYNLYGLFRDIAKKPYLQVGFSHTTSNTGPDAVTIIFQCRGDSYGSHCRSCAATAVHGYLQRCPGNKGGTIWYDQCFLDVSMINDKAPRKINYENIFSMHNPNDVIGDRESFKKETRDLFYELILKADIPTADGNNFLYYAAGEKKIGRNKLYAMVQCAHDILDCKGCLEWSIKELSKSSDGKQGARVLGTICNIRYELYPFLRN